MDEQAVRTARDEGDRVSFESPIFELLARTRHENETIAQSPEDTPELIREIIMLDGAAQGVEKRVADLIARLEPVLTQPDYVAKMAAEQSARSTSRPGDTAPQGVLAQRVAGVWARLSAVETLVEAAASRLGV